LDIGGVEVNITAECKLKLLEILIIKTQGWKNHSCFRNHLASKNCYAKQNQREIVAVFSLMGVITSPSAMVVMMSLYRKDRKLIISLNGS